MAPIEEKALYVGEAGNCLSDGTPLISGETICLVPAAEAEGSELWEAVTAGTPTSGWPRNSPPPVDAPAVDPPVEAV